MSERALLVVRGGFEPPRRVSKTPMLPLHHRTTVRTQRAQNPSASRIAAVFRPCASSGTRPNTVDPLPLIKTDRAPALSSAFIALAISGCSATALACRSFISASPTLPISPLSMAERILYNIDSSFCKRQPQFAYTSAVGQNTPGLASTR